MPQTQTSAWKNALNVKLLPVVAAILSVACAAQASHSAVTKHFKDNQKSAYRQQSATIPRGIPTAAMRDLGSKVPAADYLSEMKADGYYCWPAEKLPVKVFFQSGKGVVGYKSKFRQCLRSCFNEWSDASFGKLAWVEVNDAAQANITVRWTNTVTERAEGTEAGRTKTYATLNTRTNHGTIHAAEMLLLTRLPAREFRADEVRRAYLHEVGHAFGIAGHSHNPNDIMYYAVTEHASPHLDDRDRATINHLYNG